MTEKKFEPMKAATLLTLGQIKRWPMLYSRKLDGIRCVVRDGVALSYNLKPIRNEYVQSRIGKAKLNGLDGELVVGAPTGGEVLNRTQSGVMSKAGEPDFTFWVFDDFAAHAHNFLYRIGRAEDRVEDLRAYAPVAHLAHEFVRDEGELSAAESQIIEEGYEGVILRDPNGPYKYGRATEAENWLWKLKRFEDGEAVVIDVEEGVVNNNVAECDNFGRIKRSTHRANQVPSGRLGTLVSKDTKTGDHLRVSPGTLTAEQRVLFFREPKLILGRLFTYKSFNYGRKDAPRFATFKAFRHPDTCAP